MRSVWLMLMAGFLCGPGEAGAGTWILGVDRPPDRDHVAEASGSIAGFERGLLVGRRLDSDWRMTASLSTRSSDRDRSSDGPGSRNENTDRWVRLRLGRPLISDGPFELGWEIQLHTAMTRNEHWYAEDDGNSTRMDSHGVALILRPEIRVWRALRVSTAYGIQKLVTSTHERYEWPRGELRLTNGTYRTWDDFGGFSEWTFTVTYDF